MTMHDVNDCKDVADFLESVIDRWGLDYTLNTLAIIARHKAVHVEGNWQDAKLARAWDRVATRIETTARAAADQLP